MSFSVFSCLFSMFPSLLKWIYINMRAVPRLHCTGRKDRPEWAFRFVKKTSINSLRNDSFTLVIMWQPVWTRSCAKLIWISCKRPPKSFYSQRITLCSPDWILQISIALKQQPAFNCFGAAKTTTSDQKKSTYLNTFNSI